MLLNSSFTSERLIEIFKNEHLPVAEIGRYKEQSEVHSTFLSAVDIKGQKNFIGSPHTIIYNTII